MADKNQDIIELIIEGQDEYSDVSEAVRAELGALAEKAKASRVEFEQLERSLDLADTYRAQEQEVGRLAKAQAESRIEVDRLTKANKEAKGSNVELVAELAKAKAEFGSLRTATNRAQKAFDGTKDSMRRFGVDLKQVEGNQESYRQTTERLAHELTELSVAQTKLVATSRQEADAAREAAKAKEAQAAEEQRLTAELKQQQEAAAATEAQQRKNRVESEKYQKSLSDLITDLREGRISWQQYGIQAQLAADNIELSSRELSKVRTGLELQAIAAREYAREQDKLTAQQKADTAAKKAAVEQQRKTVEQTYAYSKAVQTLTGELKSGSISWDDYRRKTADVAKSTELTRQQIAKINKALDAKVVAARQAAAADREALAEQKKLQAQQQARLEKEKALEQQQVKTAEQSYRYAKSVQALTRELRTGAISWDDYRRKSADAARETDLSRQQIAKINRALEAQVVAAREAAAESRRQAKEAKDLQAATLRYRLELDKLINSYQAGKLGADEFGRAEELLRAKLKLSEAQVESTRRELKGYTDQLELTPDAQRRAANSTDALTKVTRRLAQAYTVLLAAQKSAQAVAGGYRAYTDSENAMLGLQKTTTLTAAEIQDLADKMEHLSSDITPTTKAQLLEVAAAAGRMGVQGAENIEKFTKSIDALSSATDLAGDDTAQAIAQILNVTGEAQKNVVGVSAAIADLGNNTATTEEQIVHFSKRLASDTATARLAASEVLGLGAALAEMGLQSEGSSTVVGRSFRFIEEAIKDGGEQMESLSRVTGLSGEALTKAYGEDKIGLFTRFLAGIGRMQDGGQTLNSILDEMGIKSDENARILGLLSQRYDGVTKAVGLSNAAFEKGNAHFEEAAKKAAALTSGFERLQNRAKALQEKFGEAFSDDLHRAMGGTLEDSEDLDESFAELGEGVADVVKTLGGLIEVVDSLASLLPGANSEIGIFDGLMTGLAMNIDAVSAAANLLVGGVAELAIAWNKFWGDTDDVEEWTQTQEKAFQRTSEAVGRYNDSLDRLNGDSSRAFQDLRDTYNENREALQRLDEDQRKAAETILKSTGYIEGNDKVYRDLTRAIQRASEEKRILAEYTAEENTALNANVALLKAQGVEEDEAIRRSKAKLDAKRQEDEAAEQARLNAAAAEKAAAEEQAKAAETLKAAQEDAEEAIKAQGEAWKALGLDIGEVTEGITEQGEEAVEAFELIAVSGEYSAKQIRQAFDSALSKTRTKADIEALIKALEDAQRAGKLTGDAFRAAFDKASDKLKGIQRDTRDAGDEVVDFTETLKESGKVGADAFSSLTGAIRELITEVKQLAEGYKQAAEEAQKMADAEADGGGGGGRRRSGSRRGKSSSDQSNKRRRGGVGAAARLKLIESGDLNAVAIFDEMIAAFAETVEGKVFSPYDDILTREPAKFAQQALALSKNQQRAARPDSHQAQSTTPAPAAQPSYSQMTRIVFNRNGSDFHLDGSAVAVQAFLDELGEVGAVTR